MRTAISHGQGVVAHLLSHQTLQQLCDVGAQPWGGLESLGVHTGHAEAARVEGIQVNESLRVRLAHRTVPPASREFASFAGPKPAARVHFAAHSRPPPWMHLTFAEFRLPICPTLTPSHLDDGAHEHAGQGREALHGADGGQHHLCGLTGCGLR